MFEGLKDKLDSFTEEAEEDVEVEAEADAEESEAKPEGEPDENVSEGETTQNIHDEPESTELDEETAADEAAEESSQADAVADELEGEESETIEDGTVPNSSEADEEPEPEDEGEEERGLRERAKLLATGKTVVDEGDLEAHLEELEFALLGSDVELEVAQEILDGVEENLVGETRRRLSSTGSLVRDALREALYDVISVGQFDFEQRVRESEKPAVLIFTGVNGVGKTTSIAKMARYFEERGLSTVLANGDTFRAGANEQLEQHADNLGKKIISHEQGSDPAAVIYDAVEYAKANGVDVVLGDTAGRLHTNEGLMDQLEKIDRVIDPDMTLFVDEAVAGQDAVNRAREFNDAAEIDGSILTKADADQQGGAAISVAYVTGKPILFLGTGQGYDDLERFEPDRIVDELLGEE